MACGEFDVIARYFNRHRWARRYLIQFIVYDFGLISVSL